MIDTILATNMPSVSKVNKPIEDVMITNQKVNPAETASALNLGDDNSIVVKKPVHVADQGAVRLPLIEAV